MRGTELVECPRLMGSLRQDGDHWRVGEIFDTYEVTELVVHHTAGPYSYEAAPDGAIGRSKRQLCQEVLERAGLSDGDAHLEKDGQRLHSGQRYELCVAWDCTLSMSPCVHCSGRLGAKARSHCLWRTSLLPRVRSSSRPAESGTAWTVATRSASRTKTAEGSIGLEPRPCLSAQSALSQGCGSEPRMLCAESPLSQGRLPQPA